MKGGTASVVLWLAGLAIWVGRGVEVGEFNVQPGEIALALVAGYGLAASAANPASRLRFVPLVQKLAIGLIAAVVAILCSAVISGVGSIDPFSVVRFSGRYVLGLLAVVALYRLLRSEGRLRILERSLLAGAAGSVALAVAGFFVAPLGELTVRYGDRAQALLNHPNQFAILLAALVPIAMSAAVRRPSFWLPWSALVLLVIGVALTGSKFNILVLGVMLPLSALFSLTVIPGVRRKLELSLTLAVLVFAIGAVGALAVTEFSPRTMTTIGNLFTDPTEVSAVSTRSELWQQAILLGLDYPFSGVGADQTGFYLPFDHAHNVFIEFFAGQGIWGLASLFVFLAVLACVIGSALLTALCRPNVTATARLGLIGSSLGIVQFVISNQSSDSFGGTTLPMLWILISMTLARLDLVLRSAGSVGSCTRQLHVVD